MIKVLHLFPAEKFTIPFIEFVNKELAEYNNIFWIYGDVIDLKEDLAKYDNVLYGSRRFFLHSRFKKELSDCDVFIVHCYGTLAAFMLFRQPKIASKTGVVFWGTDLYDHNNRPKFGPLLIKWHIKEFLKRKTLCKIKLSMTFANKDYELSRKYYGVDSLHLDILYPETVDIDEVNAAIKTSNGKTVNILIGNSATVTMRHIDVLNRLKIYKNNDIRVFIPLSYGDLSYGKSVEKYAKEVFGNKVIILKDFMNPNDYMNMISYMDIAIFNNIRQQASQNIEMAAYLGSKVFINRNSVMWDYYINEKALRFHDVINIGKESFEEFVYNSVEDININRDYFKRCWDKGYLKEMWIQAISSIFKQRS